MPNSLQGLTVLVTRPFHQAQSLCQSIEKLGGKAILLPTIAIADMPHTENVMPIVKALDKTDIVIFVSPNAVQKALPFIQRYWSSWPKTVKIAAVGASTAQSLRDQHLTVDFFPTTTFNSESLLALPALQNVIHKKIIIFCGAQGRDLLATVLRERGAQVSEAIVYQRVLPEVPVDFEFDHKAIDIIVCTSNTGLRHLMELIGEGARTWLQNMPLLVISERMIEFAKSMGFVQKPRLARNPTDAAIIEVLNRYLEERNHAAAN